MVHPVGLTSVCLGPVSVENRLGFRFVMVVQVYESRPRLDAQRGERHAGRQAGRQEGSRAGREADEKASYVMRDAHRCWHCFNASVTQITLSCVCHGIVVESLAGSTGKTSTPGWRAELKASTARRVIRLLISALGRSRP